MVFELQRADGMGDAFQRVGDAMGVVVHRVDAPLVTGANMVRAADAVDGWVAHVHIGRSHVDLGAQHHRAIGELTVPHACEQVKVLGDRTIAIGTVLASLRQRAAIFAHLLWRQIIHIGQALVDEFDREIVQRIEIIRCPTYLTVPLKTQPAHVILNGLRVLVALFFRVSVVETQVAQSVVILCQTEIQADGFGMPHMQIAVRLRGETGHDALMLARG